MPANHAIVIPQSEFTSFEFNGTHGSVLSSGESHKCALLLHGVRSDRTSMIERAQYLKTLGITSVLIDMQAHGETKGQIISFGYFESKDADNGMKYLKTNAGCEKIIVIGQ
jgi:esterase/lipase